MSARDNRQIYVFSQELVMKYFPRKENKRPAKKSINCLI